jgi:integrase
LLRYTEDISKNHQGGIKQKNINAKIVDAYANEANPERCIVRLYEKYVFLCPPQGKRPADAFYLRPLTKPQQNQWFSNAAVGINKLTSVIKDLCQRAGLGGFRSNHSLRATAATRLYDKFDEKTVCETTGHRSLAVREYERTSIGKKVRSKSCITS